MKARGRPSLGFLGYLAPKSGTGNLEDTSHLREYTRITPGPRHE